MDPLTVSLILGAGTSLIGNFLGAQSVEDTNNQNKQLFNRQLQHQTEMQQRQLDFQTKERLATQEYNSPLNQAKLYSEAGMNPLAMFQNGNAFVPTSAQTGGQGSAPAAPQMQAFQPDLSGISAFASEFAASRKSEKEADLLATQNDFARQRYALEITKLRVEAENIQGDTAYKRKLINYCDKELELLEKTLPSTVEQRKEESRLAGIRADDAQRQYEEDIITRAIRVASVNQAYNINEASLQKIKNDAMLVFEKARTEHWTRRKIKGEIYKLSQEASESISRKNLNVQQYHKNLPDEAEGIYRFSNQFNSDGSKNLWGDGLYYNLMDAYDRMNPLSGLFRTGN